jgi:hypothetical protein
MSRPNPASISRSPRGWRTRIAVIANVRSSPGAPPRYASTARERMLPVWIAAIDMPAGGAAGGSAPASGAGEGSAAGRNVHTRAPAATSTTSRNTRSNRLITMPSGDQQNGRTGARRGVGSSAVGRRSGPLQRGPDIDRTGQPVDCLKALLYGAGTSASRISCLMAVPVRRRWLSRSVASRIGCLMAVPVRRPEWLSPGPSPRGSAV